MVQLVQLEMTDFYCSAIDFADRDYHVDRIYRHTLYFFKIKHFKLMFHHVRAQAHRVEPQLPPGWHEFGANLPQGHVLHYETFKTLMDTKIPSIEQLQSTAYNQLSMSDIEVFDQSSVAEYLASVFTVQDFAIAAGQVNLVP